MTDDPRVVEGMRRQQELLRGHVRAGATQVGWKLGFGSPSGLDLLTLTAPLVGFLLDSGQRPNGSTIDVAGWRRPVVEAEIAVRLSSDLPPGSTPDRVMASVADLVPALELADADPPPTDVADILAGDIFQRLFILGDEHRAGWRSGPMDLRGTVHDGTSTTPVTDMQAITGDVLENLAHAADIGARFGRGLRAGDVILMGSVVPPAPLGPGESFTFEVDGWDPVSVATSPRGAHGD